MATRKKSKPAADPLAPTPYNPRLEFTPAQLEAFQKSLKEFGDLSGICFNVRTGHLVGGNKRAAEFRERGNVEIVEKFEEPDSTGTVAWGWLGVDGTRFVYRQVDWTEEKEAAANLAANQHGAEFDWQAVADTLKMIGDEDLLKVTGFPDFEIDNLLKGNWQPEAVAELPTREPITGHNIHITTEAFEALQVAMQKLETEDLSVAITKLVALLK